MPKLLLLATLAVILTTTSCDEDEPVYSPKPRGYCRIDLPAKKYRLYDSICPYRFEIPVYARMEQDKHKGSDPCWLNLQFPQFKATVHFSYKTVNGNLSTLLDDSHDFAKKHQIKATGLEETPILRDSARVYGLLFDIGGNTASSLQFYMTDSTKHFLRGALYFNSSPNADSIKIVLDFLRQDLIHLVQTTSWK
jgi:gliding motility-associated lipoprotein GldD